LPAEASDPPRNRIRNVTKSRFKTCFISAPFGTDTSVLRRALEEKSVRWFDQTSLAPGSNWIDAIDGALAKADFVCTVLPEGQHGNIFFELGIAFARRKPILAFAGSSTLLPTDILSLTYVRADIKNPEAVRSTLAAFLEHASGRPPRRPSKGPNAPARKQAEGTRRGSAPPRSSMTGYELESKTAALLQEAGFIVSSPTERRGQGADFAVWIDELQQSLGNPLLVEVKGGNLSSARLRESAEQLRGYAAKTHARSALLVYWDSEKREYPTIVTGWPLVFQLSGEVFTRLLRQGGLPEELVRLRNAAIHSEV
jgi:hypothetical protein